MFIHNRTWEEIREQFTPEEKAVLRQAVTSEQICPGGVEIDVDLLEPELAEKLTTLALGAARRREAGA